MTSARRERPTAESPAAAGASTSQAPSAASARRGQSLTSPPGGARTWTSAWCLERRKPVRATEGWVLSKAFSSFRVIGFNFVLHLGASTPWGATPARVLSARAPSPPAVATGGESASTVAWAPAGGPSTTALESVNRTCRHSL